MKKELALELLAQGKSQAEVAKEIGVSDRTIRRWLKDEEFKKKLQAKIKEKVKERVLKEALEQNGNKKRKERIQRILDGVIEKLDYSKPQNVENLIKLLKLYTEIEEKRKDRLLDLFKKLLDLEKGEEEVSGIKVIIQTTDEGNIS
ncbi:MAG: hypothetical protein DSY42_00475 [Aquifex sp.]|nr:MAG: hypothetical protein DSY42_00475 [Aquifex sp.]